MKKLWFRALTAVALAAGLAAATPALAGDRHHRDHGGWEHRDYRHDGYGRHHRHHKHYGHGHYRPYREVREVYYRPAPVYYSPAPVYYGPAPVYYGGRSGISGSVTVDF
jgi:hypothetical protein